MDNITIQECCDSILEIMYSKNYSESSLQSYERIFTDFLRFCETKDIVYFDMLIASLASKILSKSIEE